MLERLKLYNTLSRKKEFLKPINNKEVKIYTCGPTVYWYQHIGNLRSYVFPDILKRVLRIEGFGVKQIINVTDVGHLASDADTGEDKMEKAAKKERKSPKEIANHYLKVFQEDLKKMNVENPVRWPKATEHIKEQIDMIKTLEKKGFTYKTSDGIYFNTSKLKNYGKLAKLDVSGLEAGKRVSLREKKNKTDFALWKFSSSQKEKRKQEWKSPWGTGFPGWHIECSAMSTKYLGETFDIHTGGEDHIPIHHTNEIAQSEAATGKKFVNIWLHGAFLTSHGEKISKSTGGLYRLSELEDKGFSPMDLRYFFLSAHYKKNLNFTLKNLEYAKNSLQRLKEILSKIKGSREKKNKKNIELAWKEFLGIVNDDLNMPRALSYMWEILRENRLNDAEKYELAIMFDRIFGLDLDKTEKVNVPKTIKELVKKREMARKSKNWKESDKIRDKINKLGFVLEDTKKGVVFKKG